MNSDGSLDMDEAGSVVGETGLGTVGLGAVGFAALLLELDASESVELGAEGSTLPGLDGPGLTAPEVGPGAPLLDGGALPEVTLGVALGSAE